MKFCTNCGASLADEAAFCTACGQSFANAQTNPNPNPAYSSNPVPGYTPNPNNGYGYAPVNYAPADPYDHTHEFDPKDISDNKVVSMLVYLCGYIGIFVALLLANTSKYAGFLVRQALKFEVVNILATLVMILLCWTIIVPIAYIILMMALAIIRIVCFFQICGGKAKEPAIIRSLKFLK